MRPEKQNLTKEYLVRLEWFAHSLSVVNYRGLKVQSFNTSFVSAEYSRGGSSYREKLDFPHCLPRKRALLI
jgi:hypothetical protein